jgi:hypothetical protein
MAARAVCCLLAVCVAGDRHLPALMLKQAADSLLTGSLPLGSHGYRGAADSSVRVEVPRPEDLLLARLQGHLALRVEDNWLSLNDPQRWAIMQTKDPAKQILKSFEQIQASSQQLEGSVDVEGLERALNSLELTGEERDMWVPYWETVRREVGKIAQLFNYFRGYLERPDTAASTLEDFATSVTLASVPGRDSLSSLLDTFHSTVCPSESSAIQLFPYLHSLLEVHTWPTGPLSAILITHHVSFLPRPSPPGRRPPLRPDPVAAPAHVQPLQHHRPHRDQGLCHAAILLHDAQNIRKGGGTFCSASIVSLGKFYNGGGGGKKKV